MNQYIYKSSMKSNSLLYAIFAVCTVATLVCLMLIFPNMTQDNTYTDLLSTLPESLRESFGMVGNANQLNDYMNMNFYNSIYLYIMIAFDLIVTTKLISKPVGDTSLVYYLNSPVSRRTFYLSQTFVYVSGMIIMTVCSTVSGILTHIIALNDYDFKVGVFVKNNLILFAIFILLGSMCLLICAFCNNNSNALAYTGGLLVVEYIIYMVENMNEKFDKLKFFTVFSLYDTDKVANDTSYFVISMVACCLVSVILILGACEYFKRRDLYL